MNNNGSGNTDKYGVCLAYATVPVQQYEDTYSPEEALLRGTLFPDLYKPLGVYGCERCMHQDKEGAE